jgi:RNA polymerase sigma-70 factor (ECF subfamily)
MIETPPTSDIFRERLRDLYVRYHGFVRRACNRYVQNPDDADDLAQEVLVKAAHGWEAFTGACQPSTWLYRVAVNHCADHLRGLRRRRDALRLYAAGLETEAPPVAPERSPDAAQLLEDLGARLCARDRRIVYLRFQAGLKREGIARITGVSSVAIGKRLLVIRERAARLWRVGRPGREGRE